MFSSFFSSSRWRLQELLVSCCLSSNWPHYCWACRRFKVGQTFLNFQTIIQSSSCLAMKFQTLDINTIITNWKLLCPLIISVSNTKGVWMSRFSLFQKKCEFNMNRYHFGLLSWFYVWFLSNNLILPFFNVDLFFTLQIELFWVRDTFFEYYFPFPVCPNYFLFHDFGLKRS